MHAHHHGALWLLLAWVATGFGPAFALFKGEMQICWIALGAINPWHVKTKQTASALLLCSILACTGVFILFFWWVDYIDGVGRK